MKQAVKKKWVKALLSGKYPQWQGELRAPGGYCCLGVLRHVMNPLDTRSYEVRLTKAQLREFGLTHAIQVELSDLNDGDGSGVDSVPFDMIAGLIETAL